MDTQTDLADIDAFMRSAGVAAVADAIRRQGMLELVDHDEHVLESRGMVRTQRPALRYAETRPVVPSEQRSWLFVHWPKLALGVLAAGFLGLAVWAVVAVTLAIVAALGMLAAVLSAAIPLIALALLALLALSCLGGGGRSFTFSGSGRLH